jgi:translation initiation factor 5B
MSDKRYRVTYTGSDVVRLGRGGVFMSGTSAWCDEDVAREAAARGDFSVEGLEGAGASSPAATSSKPAAAPAGASPAPVKEEKKAEAKEDKKQDKAEAKDAKKEEKKEEPKAEKKEEAKPAAEAPPPA